MPLVLKCLLITAFVLMLLAALRRFINSNDR